MPEGSLDDRPVADALGAEYPVWDDPAVDWAAYDLVVLRSVWDYTQRVVAFVDWCRSVGPERLRNVPELIAFNVDKRYLGELEAPTVKTEFVAPGDPVPELRGEVVVKPHVSAGARHTGRFTPGRHNEALTLIETIVGEGQIALVQPYLAAVDERGETALVHFRGELSHVLRKRAVLEPDEVAPVREGDPLAVAEVMYSDDLVVAGEATPAERALAANVMAEITSRFGTPLYARVDLITGPDGTPVLLELEATEPHLYLATAPGAPERFAEAIRGSV
jgi:hypothetical protein